MKKMLLLLLCLGIGPPALLAQLPASPFSGTITASGCITVPVGNKGTVTFQVTGSWSGTIQPEGIIDGNPAFNVQVNPFQSSTPQSTVTANNVYTLNVAGLDKFLLCGATVTNTATVKGNAVQVIAKNSTGGGASGVTSFSGDGTLITNSASTGAVTVTLGGTPTGTGGPVLQNSPAFTGIPAAPTAAAATNTTQLATTAFVTAATVGCTSGCNYTLTSEGFNVSGGGSESLANANQGQYFYFFNLTKKVLGNACVQVGTAVAAQHFDVGVYSISGTTGSLAWHTGSMTTASAAAPVCTTPTPFTMLAQTNYIIAWCADITASFAIASLNSGGNLGKAASGGPAHTWGIDATDTCTAGVLPGTITTTNITNTASSGVPVAYISN